MLASIASILASIALIIAGLNKLAANAHGKRITALEQGKRCPPLDAPAVKPSLESIEKELDAHAKADPPAKPVTPPRIGHHPRPRHGQR